MIRVIDKRTSTSDKLAFSKLVYGAFFVLNDNLYRKYNMVVTPDGKMNCLHQGDGTHRLIGDDKLVKLVECEVHIIKNIS